MAEAMSPITHDPEEKFHIAYGEWAEGGWGMILTGAALFRHILKAYICLLTIGSRKCTGV